MARWTLRKTARFEAAHWLPDHDGLCARLHGHSWVLHVEVAGTALRTFGPQRGMVLDYGDVSAVLKPLVAQLDHTCLNDHDGLENPTSEVLAAWAYDRLRDVLPGLQAVCVEETCTSFCRYEEGA